MRNIPRRDSRGFTLIELIVVVVIIGLISVIALLAVSQSRAKARDAKRAGDLRAVQNALAFHLSTNGTYPGVSATYYWIDDNNYPGATGCAPGPAAGGLQPELPSVCSIRGPLGGTDHYGYTPAADGKSYKVCAFFETAASQGTQFTYGVGNTVVAGCYEAK